jgi:hypothetical protein
MTFSTRAISAGSRASTAPMAFLSLSRFGATDRI